MDVRLGEVPGRKYLPPLGALVKPEPSHPHSTRLPPGSFPRPTGPTAPIFYSRVKQTHAKLSLRVRFILWRSWSFPCSLFLSRPPNSPPDRDFSVHSDTPSPHHDPAVFSRSRGESPFDTRGKFGPLCPVNVQRSTFNLQLQQLPMSERPSSHVELSVAPSLPCRLPSTHRGALCAVKKSLVYAPRFPWPVAGSHHRLGQSARRMYVYSLSRPEELKAGILGLYDDTRLWRSPPTPLV